MRAEIITRPGATPKKILSFLERNLSLVTNYKTVVLHFGINWLSAKEEWGLYLKLINQEISLDQYNKELQDLNPPPATGTATDFRDQYQQVIEHVQMRNPGAIILVSSIIPRPWDYQRRHLVCISYNKILKSFNNSSTGIFYIHSFKPFFDPFQTLKKELFDVDGLHLTKQGSIVLRAFLCEKIDKAARGLLK